MHFLRRCCKGTGLYLGYKLDLLVVLGVLVVLGLLKVLVAGAVLFHACRCSTPRFEAPALVHKCLTYVCSCAPA